MCPVAAGVRRSCRSLSPRDVDSRLKDGTRTLTMGQLSEGVRHLFGSHLERPRIHPS